MWVRICLYMKCDWPLCWVSQTKDSTPDCLRQTVRVLPCWVDGGKHQSCPAVTTGCAQSGWFQSSLPSCDAARHVEFPWWQGCWLVETRLDCEGWLWRCWMCQSLALGHLEDKKLFVNINGEKTLSDFLFYFLFWIFCNYFSFTNIWINSYNFIVFV